MHAARKIEADSPRKPLHLVFEATGQIETLRGIVLRSDRTRKNGERGKGDRESIEAIAALWVVANSSSWMLRHVLLDSDSGKKFPHLQKYLRSLVHRSEAFPVLFNETVDLKPYRNLRIGYERITDCKNPRKRSGTSPFSPYAFQLFLRLEYLRNEQRENRRRDRRESRDFHVGATVFPVGT